VEPFLAQGGAAVVPAVATGQAQFGFSNITSLLQAEARGVPLALVAPGSGATGDPEADFAAAMVESQQYATDHPDEARAVLSSYTQIQPDVAAALTLPKYPTEIDRNSVAKLLDLGVKDGNVPDGVDLDKVFADL
jgi:ABC-type nitrate/sulfonate/bicarbonate transport system substrate-binding protein